MCVSYHFPFDKFVTCLRTLTKHIRFSIELWRCNSCAYYLQGVTLPPTLTLSLPSHTLSLSLFLSLAFLLTGSSSDKTSRGLLLLLYLLPPPALGKCVAANQRASPAVFTNGGAAEFCVVRCYVLVPGSGAGELNKSSIIETRKLERIIIRWYCAKNDIVARVWFYRHFECDFLFILWEWKQTIALSDLMSHQ